MHEGLLNQCKHAGYDICIESCYTLHVCNYIIYIEVCEVCCLSIFAGKHMYQYQCTYT